MGERYTDQPRPASRLTVAQTADQLGISEDAVRSRIKRGTLRAERVEGVVYVLLGAGRPTTGKSTDQATDPRDELIAVLREQLTAEREARRRADHIIAALTERIPELEAPPATPQEAESGAESPGGVEGREEAGEPETEISQGSRRSWWRRILGVK